VNPHLALQSKVILKFPFWPGIRCCCSCFPQPDKLFPTHRPPPSMSHNVNDVVAATNDDPPPFSGQESDPEGGADDFEVFPEDKENVVESIQQGDAAGELEITRSSVSSSVSSWQDAEPDAGEAHDAAPGLPPARRPSDSDSGESEKGLKRKLADRGPSQGPENLVPLPSAEPAKRPRDDTDKDDNPRESKRPSPPPEQKPAAAESSAPKFVRHCLSFRKLC
jgi:Ran-binding protein 3